MATCEEFARKSWNCLTSCTGAMFETSPGTFKRCLDGLVLAPWVTLSFLDIESTGCPQPCVRDVKCGTCGVETCPEVIAEEAGTLITVGNISQPGGNSVPLVNAQGDWEFPFWQQDKNDKCGAAIKSFQYQFETTGGATCKIVISDEQGSSFEYWINKTVKNIECADMAYKMKIEFGWAALNPSDPLNPSCFNDFTTSNDACSTNCVPDFATCNQDIIDACNATGRPCGTRIIARSGPLYFVPREIKPTLQNGRFIFEITGIDLMRMANEQLYSQSYPRSGATDTFIHFKQALELLCEDATPGMDIDFLAMPLVAGEPFQALNFWVPPGQSHQIRITQAKNAPCNPGGPGPLPQCEYETCTMKNGPNVPPRVVLPVNPTWACPIGWSSTNGPIGTWACENRRLLDIIKAWIIRVRADDGTCEGAENGKGIILNWDNRCPTPRLLMWADPYPSCQRAYSTNRCMGTYIVNGGKCSPVVKFEPDMKWIFNAAMRSGGNMTPATGTARQMDSDPRTACNTSGGRGNRSMPTVGSDEFMANPEQAQQMAVENTRIHTRTNAIQGMLPIEASLVVQGDPTIGSLYESIGKTIGLVVINPFFIRHKDDEILPFEKTPGCPYWDTLVRQDNNGQLSQQVVNEVLTNKNWYIKGVSHSIKEGAFQTTYKIYLPAPGADISADLPFGGSNDGYDPTPIGCFAGPGDTPTGADCNDEPDCEGWNCVPDCCDFFDPRQEYCGSGAGWYDDETGVFIPKENENCAIQTPPLPPCRIPNAGDCPNP